MTDILTLDRSLPKWPGFWRRLPPRPAPGAAAASAHRPADQPDNLGIEPVILDLDGDGVEGNAANGGWAREALRLAA